MEHIEGLGRLVAASTLGDGDREEATRMLRRLGEVVGKASLNDQPTATKEESPISELPAPMTTASASSKRPTTASAGAARTFAHFYDPNDDSNELPSIDCFTEETRQKRQKTAHNPDCPLPSDDFVSLASFELPEHFGTPLLTEFNHAVGDLVWVKMRGYPNWPGELLSKTSVLATKHQDKKTKKNPLPCRLFNFGKFSGPENPEAVVWSNGKDITFFDRLRTENELDRSLRYRLMANRYDVTSYESEYRTAVLIANAQSRAILTPEAMIPFPVTPVGVAYTNFRAHYQAPRQPSANETVKKETGVIVLRDGLENLVRDLNKFDRIWVLFQFSYAGETNRSKRQPADPSEAAAQVEADFFSGWKSMIVPPRDTALRGLFATRSPHRPNPIGLSCCKLLNVAGKVLTIRDHDLLHGTPILDIKPYLPFCDSHPEANHGWVDDLTNPGSDHRWNEKEYTVHRRAPDTVLRTEVKPTSITIPDEKSSGDGHKQT
ncbi:tRNA (adenine(37)-N6)-methyltransferase [Diplonema papillatum]|nr:tRNA (adenine(37)-N6)-methyltransferase [Diplonema papillatum]